MKVGLVHNWPGAKNSEFDIIVRIREILASWKIDSEMIDPLGNILDKNTNRTSKQVEELDLVLNLHYTNPKYLSALSYVVNWNPLAYIIDDPNTQLPIPLKQLNYYVNCIRSHDRILSASSELVDAYAQSARMNRVDAVLAEKQLYLHTTIAKQNYKAVEERPGDSLKVFYIGVNWEKVSQKEETKERHQGLFEILDQSKQFDFYGIKKLYGVELWQGISSYQGELPFDGGKSIIEKSAECGITLVLSSEQHKKSELVSTRIFQACKAGAIIISDRNPFIEKQFGDAVYYFDDQGGPDEVANNILEQVTLIQSKPKLAFQRAKEAQSIFLKNFSLENELQKICHQAKVDLQAIEHNKQKISSNKVSIIFYVRTLDESIYQQFVGNINRQLHTNIHITIVATQSVNEVISLYLQANPIKAAVAYKIINNELPLGDVISRFDTSNSAYTLFYSAGFVWDDNHVLTLLSQAEISCADVTCAPLFIEYSTQKQGLDLMDFFIKGTENQQSTLSIKHLQKLDMANYPLGNLLIANSVLELALQAKEKIVLAQFDLMSVFIMLLFADKQKPLAFASTYHFSSLLPVDNPSLTTIDFDEYQHSLDNGWLNKQRDRNALCAFMQHIPLTICVTELDPLLLAWTDEQDKNETDINQSINKKTIKALIKNSSIASPVENTPLVNHLILLKTTMKARLRSSYRLLRS